MSAPNPHAGRSTARSLADDLRRRDDEALITLLSARPDLARPAPSDLVTLTARALSPASVRRALDRLDTPHLWSLEAAIVAAEAPAARGSAEPGAVATLLGCSPERARDLLDGLQVLALVWRAEEGDGGPGAGYIVPRPVAEVLGPVAGLAPAHPLDDAGAVGDAETGGSDGSDGSDDTGAATTVGHLLDDAPRGARELLDRLTWGPPTGVLDPAGPLGAASRWLVERRLLRVTEVDGRDAGNAGGVGDGNVVLPRPVALALRGGRLYRDDPDPPALPVIEHDVARIDAAAGARAADVLGLVEEIAHAYGEEPPRVLRAGGLSVRDLQRTADRIGHDVHATGLLLEVMRAARLLADDGAATEAGPAWAPTRHYDDWVETDEASRWAALVLAWRDLPRAPHRVGTRGEGGPVNVFSADVALPGVVELRREALTVLAQAGAGAALAPQDLAARLVWQRPRRAPELITQIAHAATVEAELLGVTGAGALSSAGRVLLDPDSGEDEVAAAAQLPEPVDRVVLQADLTAVVPGRPTPLLAAFLRRAADVESRGGATTYRFGVESIGRILDDGWDPAEVTRMLETSSLTPVPQPLAYLVTDAARRHGRARVGAVTSYVRSDDVAALDALLADPEAASARLRRIAPTVLVSPISPTHLLAVLRRAGLSALAEGADGTVVSGAAAPARAATPRRSPVPVTLSVDAAGVVAALRAADARNADPGRATSGARRNGPGEAGADAADRAEAGLAGEPEVPRTDPAVSLALIRRAATARDSLWIGVVGPDGVASRRQVRPTRVAGGLIHAVDLATGRVEAYSVHRVTGVRAGDGEVGL